MMTIDETTLYSRQYNIISKGELDFIRLLTIGCGIGGSWVTYMCAKMGISNIDVYDFDVVEDANIPSQLFGFGDIGKYKVNALLERIKSDVGIDIEVHQEKVDSKTDLNLTGNTIVLNMVDSIEARKDIVKLLKGNFITMIDARIGGEVGYQIYVVNMSDEEEVKNYEKTLEGSFVDLPCGTKAIIYSSLDEVSQIVNIIKRIIKGEKYPKVINKSVVNFDQIVKW